MTGVGGMHTEIKGWGTVESEYKGQKYILTLSDILHIPKNRNNLILLGRWDDAGRAYRSDTGVLKLITSRGMVVAEGRKVHNHLYRMLVKVNGRWEAENKPRLLTN